MNPFTLLSTYLFIINLASAMQIYGPQVLPENYVGTVNKRDRSPYTKHVLQHREATNSQIPRKNKDHLRVMTYNIQFFKDIYGKYNVEALFEDIRVIKADIILFQEVPYTNPNFKTDFEQKLFDNGYKNRVLAYNTDPRSQTLGNMVASKYSVENRIKGNLPEPVGKWSGRSYAMGSIRLTDGTDLYLMSAHLSVDGSENRRVQAQEIAEQASKVKYAGELAASNRHRILIGGDFNVVYDKPELNALHKPDNPYLNGVWQVLNWPQPNFTCWANTTVDHFFVGDNLQPKVVGVYVYLSVASDHIPVIVDLDVKAASPT